MSRERLQALCRLLIGSGDMTPVAERMLLAADAEDRARESAEVMSTVQERVAIALREADETASSDDPLIQLAWLIQGLSHWYATDGKVGNSPEETKTAVLSRYERLSRSHVEENDG